MSNLSTMSYTAQKKFNFDTTCFFQHKRHMPATSAAPRPRGIPIAERNAVTALHLEHSPHIVANLETFIAETFQRKIEYVSTHISDFTNISM